MAELLLGCGSNLTKKLSLPENPTWTNLVTLDFNSDHKPDIVWDLMELPLPFDSNSFTEIHAYEVLEHLGSQGDYRLFFKQFTEFHRLLQPGGKFFATCPSRHSAWAWGDPSHTRILQSEQLHFLSQANYEAEVGRTAMSDFRWCYKADFKKVWVREDSERFEFCLEAIK